MLEGRPRVVLLGSSRLQFQGGALSSRRALPIIPASLPSWPQDHQAFVENPHRPFSIHFADRTENVFALPGTPPPTTIRSGFRARRCRKGDSRSQTRSSAQTWCAIVSPAFRRQLERDGRTFLQAFR
jgi:hypothetical protein